MGTGKEQAELWGPGARDWSDYNEPMCTPFYEAVLDATEVGPGTVLLDVTDPSHDDNGPGNYAYPTAADFHAGAFDIQEFRVILSPDGSTVTFKLQLRNLAPTFGSPLGAQLGRASCRERV